MKSLDDIAKQPSSFFDELIIFKEFEAEWNKVIYYCNYRERCVFEVKTKMNELELSHNIQEDFLVELKRLQMIDDERFAVHFAKSKFNIKHWGRNKIKQELLQKKIYGPYITEGLYAIDNEQYIEKLDELLHRKYSRTKSKSKQDLQMKLYRYAYYKGYESDLIRSRMEKLLA